MGREPTNQEQRSDEALRQKLPPGLRLVHTLRGHSDTIGRIAWSSGGSFIASPSFDKTVRIWNPSTGQQLQELKGHTRRVVTVAWAPDANRIASGGDEERIRIWDARSGEMISQLQRAHERAVVSLAWSPSGELLASGGWDGTIGIWDGISGRLLDRFHTNHVHVTCVAWSRSGDRLAACGYTDIPSIWSSNSWRDITPAWTAVVNRNRRIYGVVWSVDDERLFCASASASVMTFRIAEGLVTDLEGHTGEVRSVSCSADGQLIASKGAVNDNSVRLWDANTFAQICMIPESSTHSWRPNLAFHPQEPFLATLGDQDAAIRIWELDIPSLLGQVREPSAHYVNAKVVLVGDTGVGKSGLSLVLNRQPFQATDSTPGRRVWMFDSREVAISSNVKQTRETLLWDLAGQPGYRVIHQLHLNEVAVALVVFDARSEIDPLAGVRHWERALRLAHERQGAAGIPMRKLLVSARNDRGGVSIGEERLHVLLKEFGFDAFFKTSAKEGWQIADLREAIEQAIPWGILPEVLSSRLFADIKSFLLTVKQTGQLLALSSQLFDDFAREHLDIARQVTNLQAQFDTCIGRLENRDLIRRLTFGGYLLLQPELLDAYASAMVNAAKDEPDGLGSLAEDIALTGKFFVPTEQKITDLSQEQLLLHATVEELVRHDLALRENADDGRYLVFPSQFNRDYEDAPEPKGKAVAITFDGPVQSLYSTLAVRLGHSGLFTTGRFEMWRNAAIFNAKAGGNCGLFVYEFAEARGRLILFFDDYTSVETRFHFEEFVVAHVQRRALRSTVEVVRFFVCSGCGDPVPDNYVKRLRDKGTLTFSCPCGGAVELVEPKERLHFLSQVDVMDESADGQRDFDAFVMSAKGETSTRSFREWAGGDRITLAIVFTDVLSSTAIGEEIRDEAMDEVRRAHFARSRELIDQFNGREIKTIGDSFMAAFRSADGALDFARSLQKNTGHTKVQVRAGIHIGPMHVDEGDVFGGTVNFAARVVGAIEAAEIWLSNRAKEDIDRLGAANHNQLSWQPHEGIVMKGFSGSYTLWSLKNARRKPAP
ncbi:MAG: hypothetical protein JWO70_1103 [Betaproteobacteria bacterium]|nr:hypothetical protein [Betaproteobacteria bacterium]